MYKFWQRPDKYFSGHKSWPKIEQIPNHEGSSTSDYSGLYTNHAGAEGDEEEVIGYTGEESLAHQPTHCGCQCGPIKGEAAQNWFCNYIQESLLKEHKKKLEKKSVYKLTPRKGCSISRYSQHIRTDEPRTDLMTAVQGSRIRPMAIGLYETDKTQTFWKQGSNICEGHGGGCREASRDPNGKQDKKG